MAKINCLDTYALVEIYYGNSKFLDYLNHDFVITELTLAEFYGVLYREKGKDEADLWFKKLQAYSVVVDKETLIEAIAFRYENRKKNLSFFDCVGYIFSLKKSYPFVTGDKEFENLPFVEFIKK